MVVKVYISGISGNKEVKKRQQRVLMILDSKTIKYDLIDITEPGKEADKDFMQSNSKSNGGTVSDPNPRSALPPQIFNDEKYCGDYDLFDLANEVDTLEQFLKMEVPPEEQVDSEKVKPVNGISESKEENSEIKEDSEVPQNIDETAGKKEKSPVKEDSPAKEGTPSKDADAPMSKEGTPAHNENEDAEGETKDKSPEKEIEERQKSVEKESTPEKLQSPEKEIETNQASKENTPEKEEAINENGTFSSREQSEDKDAIEDDKIDAIERKKDNPSEALIQSEQAAATE